MMSVEGSTITSRIKNLLRSPSIKLRRSKPGNKREDIGTKVSAGIVSVLLHCKPPFSAKCLMSLGCDLYGGSQMPLGKTVAVLTAVLFWKMMMLFGCTDIVWKKQLMCHKVPQGVLGLSEYKVVSRLQIFGREGRR